MKWSDAAAFFASPRFIFPNIYFFIFVLLILFFSILFDLHLLPLGLMFCGAIFLPHRMGLWMVGLMAFGLDMWFERPLGMGVLIYTSLYGGLLLVRRVLSNQSFLWIWGTFGLTILMCNLFEYLFMISLGKSIGWGGDDVVKNLYIFGIFPVVVWSINRIFSRFLSRS